MHHLTSSRVKRVIADLACFLPRQLCVPSLISGTCSCIISPQNRQNFPPTSRYPQRTEKLVLFSFPKKLKIAKKYRVRRCSDCLNFFLRVRLSIFAFKSTETTSDFFFSNMMAEAKFKSMEILCQYCR